MGRLSGRAGPGRSENCDGPGRAGRAETFENVMGRGETSENLMGRAGPGREDLKM